MSLSPVVAGGRRRSPGHGSAVILSVVEGLMAEKMDGKTATTPRTKAAAVVSLAATPSVRKPGGSASSGSSKSHAECKTPGPAASLSAGLEVWY